MERPLKLAMVGVGRIGVFHARHMQELARETGVCELVAVSDTYGNTAEQVAGQLQAHQDTRIESFTHVKDLASSGLIDAAMIASRTEAHHTDARTLIEAGCRVLLEKPLTHSVASAEEFVAYLSAGQQDALMLAFMRRFDGPLQLAKDLLDRGTIGRPFKIVSILEDSLPPPEGYSSPGLLIDMSVHNIDEILWLTGKTPTHVTALGANLYNTTISSVKEDFDDGFIQMWFPDTVLGQIQVSRNHVAGYRNETWIFGDGGNIHVGHFQDNPLEVAVEAYSPRGAIQKKTFALRDYGADVPVFIKRFGEAYKQELATFVDQCLNTGPFSVTQADGLNAMRVSVAATEAIRTATDARKITY